jgi:hypothetical protein
MDDRIDFQNKSHGHESQKERHIHGESYDLIPGLSELVDKLRAAYPSLTDAAVTRILGLPDDLETKFLVAHDKNQEDK